MTANTATNLTAQANTNLADNTSGDISAADVRSLIINIIDSYRNVVDEPFGELADWDSDVIGTTIQGYDANTAMTDTAQTFTEIQTFDKAIRENVTAFTTNIDWSIGGMYYRSLSSGTLNMTDSNEPASTETQVITVYIYYSGGDVVWPTGWQWVGGVPTLVSGENTFVVINSYGLQTLAVHVNKA